MIEQLIPVFLALIALAKVYMELRYTRTERDAVIRGVQKHRDVHAGGDHLKARIKHEAEAAGVEARVKKAVKRVRENMK